MPSSTTISVMTISMMAISVMVRPRGSVQPNHHISDDHVSEDNFILVMIMSVMTISLMVRPGGAQLDHHISDDHINDAYIRDDPVSDGQAKGQYTAQPPYQ